MPPMSITHHLKRIACWVAGRTIGPVIWMCIIAYFAFYAVYGDRGMLSMGRLRTEVEQAKANLDKVHEERVQLERRTTLLRPDSLDLDMVDERARQMLNMSHADDVIIMVPARRDGTRETAVAPRSGGSAVN